LRGECAKGEPQTQSAIDEGDSGRESEADQKGEHEKSHRTIFRLEADWSIKGTGAIDGKLQDAESVPTMEQDVLHLFRKVKRNRHDTILGCDELSLDFYAEPR
jgi:hypothetical protein